MRPFLHRRPDRVARTTIAAGIAALLSAGTLAASPPTASPGTQRLAELSKQGVHLAVTPVRDLAGRLRLHWVEARLQDDSIADLVSGGGLRLNRSGRQAADLRLRWRAPGSIRAAEREAASMGSGISVPGAPRTGIFITLDKRW